MVMTTVKSPRRRAKQERAQATVSAVVEAAARVLLDEGYARATTNRIADAAGVSVGTLYQYFSSKDEIFDALIHREIAALESTLLIATPDPKQSLAEGLRVLLQEIIRARPDTPSLYRALEHVPNALLRRRLGQARGRVVTFIRDILRTRRGLRVSDLDTAAFLIVAATEGVAMNATIEFFRGNGVDELASMLARYLER